MARPRPVPLRETTRPLRADARVIDAQFKVVRGPRGKFLKKLVFALLATIIAATIGFLIPPLWMLAQTLNG